MGTYSKIITIMQNANAHIQYPRIHLQDGYVLQRNGSNSKYPGSISITDGKPYGQNIYYGRIAAINGQLCMPNYMQKHGEALQYELDRFQLNPAKYASCYGRATANCMFCYKKLTNKQSVAVGYGPTCATNYGLAWGEYSQADADAMSSLQFDMPNSNGVRHEGNSRQIEKQLRHAENYSIGKEAFKAAIARTDCTCGRYPPNMACMQEHCEKEIASKPSTTAEQMAIESLNDVCVTMLSNGKQDELANLISLNPDDEYMLMITALWEAL